MGRLANCPTLIAAAIASVCRAAGPVGVLKRVAPAEAAVAPGIGHALLERIEPAVRSAPATSSVFGAPRRSRGCIGAQHEGGQQDGCHGEGAHEVPPQSSPTQPKKMASQNGFHGATALPLSCGKYVEFFSPRTLLAETPLADWAERIRTSKRQFDEVLGTSAEFSCTAEAIC